MPDLLGLVDDYMNFRAARGFQPSSKINRMLTQFVGSLPEPGDSRPLFTHRDALSWAHASATAGTGWHGSRLSVVRGFACYLAGRGLRVEIPPERQGVTGSRRATPHLYTRAEVHALCDAAESLFTPLRAATMTTLICLLVVTGMRGGEARRLSIGEVNLHNGRVVISQAKFGRQRVVRLHPTSCRAIRAYLDLPARAALGERPENALLVTRYGTPMAASTAQGAFEQMRERAGLLSRASVVPRLHDFRHSFATQAMIDSYEPGDDPARILSVLSAWLGHSNPADTYWYLQAAPEVAALAAHRLDLLEES